MRKGTLELPNGVVCAVREFYSQKTPKYKAPPPFGDDVWFVVPTDKRPLIKWED